MQTCEKLPDFHAVEIFSVVAPDAKKREARGKCEPKPAYQQQRKTVRPFLPPSHVQGQI